MTKLKRILAFLLVCAMVVGSIPATSLAAPVESTVSSDEVQNDPLGAETDNQAIPIEEIGEGNRKYTIEGDMVYVYNENGDKLLYSDCGNTKGLDDINSHITTYADYNIWDTFEFGEYPQTRVTDNNVISRLNSASVDSNGVVKSDGKKYKKLNGNYYLIEPIVWRVAYTVDSNTLLIMSEKVLDSQVWNDNNSNLSWENSTVRKWLNETFMKAAFSTGERSVIHKTNIDNSSASSSLGYGSNNTTDKIFLFSEKDLTNPEYQFSSNASADDSKRCSLSTDYAQAMGASSGYCNYWTRSCNASTVRYVLSSDGCVGSCHSTVSPTSTGYGIRPVMQVDATSPYYNSASTAKESVTFAFLKKDDFKGMLLNDITFDIYSLAGESITVETDNSTSVVELDDSASFEWDREATKTIRFKLDKYYDYIIDRECISDTFFNVTMQPEVNNTKPYVSTVFYQKEGFIDWSNGTSVALNIPETDTDTYHIKVKVNWRNHGDGTIYLAQDEAHKISSKDGEFSISKIGEVFKPNTEIYAYCVGKDGVYSPSVKTKLNITENDIVKDKITSGKFNLLGDTGALQYTFKDDIPVFGGSTFGLDLGDFPISIEKEGDSYKVSLGIEIFSKNLSSTDKKKKEKEEYNKFKDLVKQISKVETISDVNKKADAAKTYYKQLKHYKETLAKWRNGGKEPFKTKGKLGKSQDVNVDFNGYVEFQVVNNKIIVTESYGYFTLEWQTKWNQQYIFGWVPVYTQIKFGVEGELGAKISRVIPDRSVPFESTFVIQIAPKGSLEVGAGVPDWVSAGIKGAAKLPIKYTTSDHYLTIDLNATVGISVKARWFVIFEKDFLDETWNVYHTTIGKSNPKSAGPDVNTMSDNELVLKDESSYTKLSDRTNSLKSAWHGSDTSGTSNGHVNTNASAPENINADSLTVLESSTYEETQVKLIEHNGVRLMTWITDNHDRASSDRTQLVYSIYNSSRGTWSEPLPVDNGDLSNNAGTADYCPSVVGIGDDIYIAWEDSKISYADLEEFSLETHCANTEIKVAKYSTLTGTMSDPVALTDNGVLDTNPRVIDANGKAVVLWISNDENSLFGTSGTNSFMYAEVSDNLSIQNKRTLTHPNAVIGYDAVYDNGQVKLVASVDKDNDLSDFSDTEIYLYSVTNSSATQTQLTDNASDDSAPKFAVIDGQNTLFYYRDSNIYYRSLSASSTEIPMFTAPEGEEVQAVGSDSYTIASNEYGDAYILWAQNDDQHVELFGSVYRNGSWGTPISVTDVDQKILNPSACLNNDGNISVAFDLISQEEARYDSESEDTIWVERENNLALFEYQSGVDLQIQDNLIAFHEDELEPGLTIKLPVIISNNGAEDCSGYQIYVNDVSAYTDYEVLASGASREVEFDYTLPDTIEHTELDIEVKSDYETELNTADNSIQTSYGYAKLHINEMTAMPIGDQYHISVNIENRSYIGSDEFQIILHDKDENGPVLTEWAGDEPLAGWHYSAMNTMIHTADLSFDENHVAILYAEVVDEQGQAITSDTIAVEEELQDTISTKLIDLKTENGKANIYGVINNMTGGVTQGWLKVKVIGTSNNVVNTATEFIELQPGQIYNIEKSLDLKGYSNSVTAAIEFEGKKLYDYGFDADGNIILTAYYGDEADVIIPETISGIPVIGIGSETFAGHGEMQSVTIPDSVCMIGGSAFSDTTGLKAIHISKNVTTIGNNAFSGCTGLTELTVASENPAYSAKDNVLFSKDGKTLILATSAIPAEYTVPFAVETIANKAFAYNETLRSITFNRNLNTIGTYAMSDCINLKKMILPDTLDSIGNYCFDGCESLEEIDTGDGIATIPQGAFANCNSVKQIRLGKKITALGKNAFTNMSELTSIQIDAQNMNNLTTSQTAFYKCGVNDGICVVISNDVKRIPAYFFNGSNQYQINVATLDLNHSEVEIGKYAFYNNTKLKSIDKSEKMNLIGDYAFYNCTSLKNISLASVEEIGSYGFYGCTSMDVSEWSEQLKYIGDYAFYNNRSITSISYPASLLSVGQYAFYSCSMVESFVYNTNNVVATGNTYNSLGYSGSGITLTFGSQVKEIPARLFNGMSCKFNTVTLSDSIERIGEYAFYGCNTLQNLNLNNGLEVINNYAFYNCYGIKELNLPASLKVIGNYAFYACYGYTELDIPDSVTSIGTYAFYNNNGVTNLTIGSGVSTINEYTFGYMTGLKNVTIPANVTKIKENAFYYCNSLESVDLSAFSGDLDANAFNRCDKLILEEPEVTIVENGIRYNSDKTKIIGVAQNITGKLVIPDNVVEIGANAFENQTGITSVEIAGTVTTIDSRAFYNCYNITSLTLKDGLSDIGDYAFYGCNGITNLKLPRSLSDIGDYAFYNLYKVNELVIPDRVKRIGNYAFSSWSALKRLTIGEGVRSIGSYAFNDARNLEDIIFNAVSCDDFTLDGNSGSYVFHYASYNTKNLTVTFGDKVKRIPGFFTQGSNNKYVKTVNMGKGITEIGQYAFSSQNLLTDLNLEICTELEKIGRYAYSYCTGIDHITIEGSATEIGDYAFQNCTAAEDINIGVGVASIGTYAFQNCTAVNNINIGDGVASIGTYAFQNCSAVIDLTLGESVREIGHYAFAGLDHLTTLNYNAVSIADRASSSTYYFNRAGYYGDGITVNIGEDVKRIPSYMFYPYNGSSSYANKIVAVHSEASHMEVGEYAFYYCNSLTTVDGSGWEDIGRYAWSYCNVLNSFDFTEALSIGEYAFYGCSTLDNVSFNDQLSYLGTNAFYNCASIKEVILPDSLQTIGSNCFQNCTGLENFDTGDGVSTIESYALYNCSGLKSLRLGESIVNVGYNAFYSLSALEVLDYDAVHLADRTSNNNTLYFERAGINGNGIAMTIGGNVEYIPNYLFYPYNGSSSYQNKLYSVNSLADHLSIGNYAFYYCQSLTEVNLKSVTDIGNYAFYNCSALANATVNNAHVIGDYAFYNCSSMADITFGNQVRAIGTYAFYNCSSLQSFDTGDVLTTIGAYALYNCSGLKTLTLGESLTTIGICAFYNLSNLETLNYNSIHVSDRTSSNNTQYFDAVGTNGSGYVMKIGEKVARIPAYMFYPYNGNSSYDRNNIAEVQNNATDLEIGAGAFYMNRSLKSFDFEQVCKIGEGAFRYCSGLTSDVKLTSLKELGINAFSNATSMKSVDTGDLIKEIPSNAFTNCTGLETLRIGINVNRVDSQAFNYLYYLNTLRFDAVSCEDISTANNNSQFYQAGYYTNNGFDVIVGNGVTRIPGYFFSANGSGTKINHVVCSKTVKEIGPYAFYYATVGSVSLNQGLETIGQYALNRTGLLELTIPSSVTAIGQYAFGFNNSSRLTNALVKGTSGTEAEAYATRSNITFEPVGTVSDTATKLTFEPSEITLGVGCEKWLNVNVEPIGSQATIRYTSFDATIVSVTNDGKITAKKTGTARITATCGSVTATCTVTVVNTNDLSGAEVRIGQVPSYNGSPIMPSVSVYLDGKKIPSSEYEVTYENNVDVGKAKITITGIGTYTGSVVTYFDIICNHSWSVETLKQATCSAVGSEKHVCRVCGAEETVDTACIPHTPGNWVTDKEANYVEDGIMTKYCTVCDQPVETSTIPKLADTTSPEVVLTVKESLFDRFLSTISIGLYTSDEVTITIDASDAESGIASVAYLVSEKELTEDEVQTATGWTDYADACTISKEHGMWIVYAKAIDRAGNVTIVNSNGIYFDLNAPVINGVADQGEYCKNVSFSVMDENLYEVYVDETEQGLLQKYTINKAGTHSVRAIDMAGNITEASFKIHEDHPSTKWVIVKSATATEPGIRQLVCQVCGAVIDEEETAEELPGGSCGASMQWSFNSGTGELSITGSGAMKTYTYTKEVPWYQYAGEIKSVKIGPAVESISSYSFYGLTALKQVVIPSGVTTIGEYAFKNCTGLEEISLPTSLTKLGASAFFGCSSLKSITIPEGLYTIWEYTFKNCTALTSVNLPGTLIKIDEAAFYGCSSLTSLVVPNSVNIVGQYAFKNCTKLVDLSLSSNMTEIREAAFYGTALETLTLPAKVTKIGPYAFKNCTKLVTLNLPDSLLTIGESAFYGSSMATLTLPDSVTTIGSYAFKGCAKLTQIHYPANLTKIGDSAFYYCTSITSIDLPSKLTTIEGYAFKNCTGLIHVGLPDSLKTIGDSAFYSCTALPEITIPSNVTSVGEYCFSKDEKLKSITFAGNAPAIGTGAFKSVTANAYYPAGNTSWTSEKRANYGGTIQWIAK